MARATIATPSTAAAALLLSHQNSTAQRQAETAISPSSAPLLVMPMPHAANGEGCTVVAAAAAAAGEPTSPIGPLGSVELSTSGLQGSDEEGHLSGLSDLEGLMEDQVNLK